MGVTRRPTFTLVGLRSANPTYKTEQSSEGIDTEGYSGSSLAAMHVVDLGVNVGKALYRLLLIHKLVTDIPRHQILIAGYDVTVRIYEKYRSFPARAMFGQKKPQSQIG